jgi:hypothetical protein
VCVCLRACVFACVRGLTVPSSHQHRDRYSNPPAEMLKSLGVEEDGVLLAAMIPQVRSASTTEFARCAQRLQRMLATLACAAVLRTSATSTCTCANFTNRVTCIILHFSVRRLLSTCAVLAHAPARQFHKASALYNATPTPTRPPPPTTGGQGAPWAPRLCPSAVRQVQVWLAQVQERVQVGHGPQAGARSVACVLLSFLHPLLPFQPSFLTSSFLPPLLPFQPSFLTSSFLHPLLPIQIVRSLLHIFTISFFKSISATLRAFSILYI